MGNLTVPFRSTLLQAPFSDIINVRDFGAQGNGVADDGPAIQRAFNYAYGPPANPHGAAPRPNKVVQIPAGTFLIGQQLFLNHANGVSIIGAGQRATRLVYTGPNSKLPGGNVTSLLTCLSFDFSRVFGITFDVKSSNASVCVQMSTYPGAGDDGKSITWMDCGFVGASDDGFLCTIDGSGQTGSEMLFIGCTWDSCTYGVMLASGNGLNYSFLGGSVVNCVRGFNCPVGSFGAIAGISFDNPSHAVFNGTFSGGVVGSTTTSTLTVNSLSSGAVQVGQFITGSGVTAGTVVTGGSGSTWTVQYAGAVATPTAVAMVGSGLDIYVQQANPPAVIGCRSTSPNLCLGGPIVLTGCSHIPSVAGGIWNAKITNQDNPIAILKGNYLGPNSGVWGNSLHLAYLYGNASANSSYLANFSAGTVVRDL